jgi:CRISPR-associated protein Cas2
MAADSKWYLVCYDVRDDRRLRKCAKHVEGYGTRLQYSIFRCWLSYAQVQQLRWELTEILKPEDDVLFIPVCERCLEGLEVTHSSAKQPDWPQTPRTHKIV